MYGDLKISSVVSVIALYGDSKISSVVSLLVLYDDFKISSVVSLHSKMCTRAVSVTNYASPALSTLTLFMLPRGAPLHMVKLSRKNKF